MSLSTFNSKTHLLRWLMMGTASFLVAYTYALNSTYFRYGGGVGTSDLQNCIIRAERYLFDLKDPDIVFVGTSRTGRVRLDLMGERYFNLAHPCTGVAGGLFYVNQKVQKPRVLVMEVTELGELFIAGPEVSHESVPLWLRKQLKPLRQEYKLFLVLKNVFKYGLKIEAEKDWFLPTRIDRESGKPYLAMADVANLQSRAEVIAPKLNGPGSLKHGIDPMIDAYVRRNNESCRTKTSLAAIISAYKDWTLKAQQSGSAVVFLEPPEHPDIFNTECRKIIRSTLQAALPEVLYIENSHHRYSVPDGTHLEPEEAIHYSANLQLIIEKNFPTTQTKL